MTRQEAIRVFSTMSAINQARFLARLAHDETIWTRHEYHALTGSHEQTAHLLTAHNELQHRIVGQLVHLLEGDKMRYPDDVFVNILFDMAEGAGCLERLEGAFHGRVQELSA